MGESKHRRGIEPPAEVARHLDIGRQSFFYGIVEHGAELRDDFRFGPAIVAQRRRRRIVLRPIAPDLNLAVLGDCHATGRHLVDIGKHRAVRADVSHVAEHRRMVLAAGSALAPAPGRVAVGWALGGFLAMGRRGCTTGQRRWRWSANLRRVR